jgi:hypothetical protein
MRRALEIWLLHEELRDLHILYFDQTKSYGLSSISHNPMFLLAVTYTTTLHVYCKLLAPLHVWFCTKYVYVCVVSYLLICVFKYVCLTHHILVYCFEPNASWWYLIWLSLKWLMEHPILGEWYALCISLSLKCVYMGTTT